MKTSESPARVGRRSVLAAIALGRPLLAQGLTVTAVAPVPQEAWVALRDRSRQLLTPVIAGSDFRGQLPAPVVREVLAIERTPIQELMISLLPLARANAHPPLSGFRVGAVVRGATGSLYLGANIEVPGNLLGLCVHAEQAAIANAFMYQEPGITDLAVTAAPCGHCRQFLQEVSIDGLLRVLVKGSAPTLLSTLLPMPFGPNDLGFKEGALPPRDTRLTLRSASLNALAAAALTAARRSYSPYTKSHSGVAITTSDGRVYSGSYIENAAFNPSLPPLQAALAGYYAARESTDRIASAVLVEVTGAAISQESGFRATLQSLAPNARVEIVQARRR